MCEAAGASVLAAVITYNPGPGLVDRLRALQPQCAKLVVIDNASHCPAAVEDAAQAAGALFVRNDRNLGIASGLQQAAAIAFDGRFGWIATFDQDSACPPGAITSLLALHRTHPQREQIGIVCMAQRDRATGREYHHRLDVLQETPEWRFLRSTITSGMLVKVELLHECGPFEERLFIDSVDHEFCLRLRRHGWKVLEARRVVLQHSIGSATQHRLFGRAVVCTHHSPLRLYYRTRNQLEVAARNLVFDPVWSVKAVYQLVGGLVAVVVFEEDRWPKMKGVIRGLAHFLLRRFGPYEDRPPTPGATVRDR